jgi:hypothetical protein
MRKIWWNVGHPKIIRPIFIIGCSRAGTTFVYRTFAESSELGSLNRETHDFWAALHPLSERGWISHALTAEHASQRDREIVMNYFYVQTGKTRFVDKNNQNSLCIPYLHNLFPDATFVYVKRSPGDNIHSLIEGWGKDDVFATWSGDLPETVAIEHGKYRRWCFFLSEAWRDYLTAPIEEVCAFQYRSVNQAIIEAHKEIPDSQWTEVHYEDLVKDPVEGFRRAFEAVGLSFDSDLKKHCEKVLSRPYNAFSDIRLDKWRLAENRKRIERVLPGVSEIASEMGYEL